MPRCNIDAGGCTYNVLATHSVSFNSALADCLRLGGILKGEGQRFQSRQRGCQGECLSSGEASLIQPLGRSSGNAEMIGH